METLHLVIYYLLLLNYKLAFCSLRLQQRLSSHCSSHALFSKYALPFNPEQGLKGLFYANPQLFVSFSQ